MQPVFVLMILEMLCVNLYVGHICHERKASPVIVVPVMAAFTLLLLGLSALTISTLPGYGEGSFVIFGFLECPGLSAGCFLDAQAAVTMTAPCRFL